MNRDQAEALVYALLTRQAATLQNFSPLPLKLRDELHEHWKLATKIHAALTAKSVSVDPPVAFLEAQGGLNIDGAHVPPGHARAARLAHAALRGERPLWVQTFASSRSAAGRIRKFRAWCMDFAPAIAPHLAQRGAAGDRVVITRPVPGLRRIASPDAFGIPRQQAPAESA